MCSDNANHDCTMSAKCSQQRLPKQKYPTIPVWYVSTLNWHSSSGCFKDVIFLMCWLYHVGLFGSALSFRSFCGTLVQLLFPLRSFVSLGGSANHFSTVPHRLSRQYIVKFELSWQNHSGGHWAIELQPAIKVQFVKFWYSFAVSIFTQLFKWSRSKIYLLKLSLNDVVMSHCRGAPVFHTRRRFSSHFSRNQPCCREVFIPVGMTMKLLVDVFFHGHRRFSWNSLVRRVSEGGESYKMYLYE